MKKIHIFITAFVGVALDSTATAALPQSGVYSNQLGEVDARKSGHTDSVYTEKNPHIIARSKVDSCDENIEYPGAGCAPETSRRGRRAEKQSYVKSDPRRWISTLGF